MESKYLIFLCTLFVAQVQCQNEVLQRARKLRALGDDITTVISDIKKLRDNTMPYAIKEIGDNSQKLVTDAGPSLQTSKNEIAAEIARYVTKVDELTTLGAPESCTKGKTTEIKAKDVKPLTDLQTCVDAKKNLAGTITSTGITCLLNQNKRITKIESDRTACKEDLTCLVKQLMEAEQLKADIVNELTLCSSNAKKTITQTLNDIKICGRRLLSVITVACENVYSTVLGCIP